MDTIFALASGPGQSGRGRCPGVGTAGVRGGVNRLTRSGVPEAAAGPAPGDLMEPGWRLILDRGTGARVSQPVA